VLNIYFYYLGLNFQGFPTLTVSILFTNVLICYKGKTLVIPFFRPPTSITRQKLLMFKHVMYSTCSLSSLDQSHNSWGIVSMSNNILKNIDLPDGLISNIWFCCVLIIILLIDNCIQLLVFPHTRAINFITSFVRIVPCLITFKKNSDLPDGLISDIWLCYSLMIILLLDKACGLWCHSRIVKFYVRSARNIACW
jgi:hypothetical protein